MRKWSSVAVLCLMLMIASGVAHAGPAVLNPPTYPVCTSDYPILLNTGSYILGSNFTVTCSKDVFEIIGNNVTLDLGGYTITGKGGVGSGNGVSGGEHYNVTVKNGTILNVPGKGIAIGENATVTDVAVFGAGGVGISVESGTIRHVQSDGNGSDGVDSLDTQSPAAVEDSQVSGNNGNGIAASNALISNNTLIGNFEFGLECAGCTITRNTVEENGAGILSFFSQITDNTVLFNFGDGIITPEPSSVIGNTIGQNENLGLDVAGDDLTSYGTNLFFFNGEETLLTEPQTNGGVQISPNVCDGEVSPPC